MHPEIFHKVCKFYEYCARNTPCVAFVFLDLVKFSVFGVLYPYRCTNRVKFGMEDGGLEEWTCGAKNLKVAL